MPAIAYRARAFQQKTLAVIADARRICEEYARDGYSLTLRQLYYVFVAHDLFPDDWIDPVYNRLHNLDPLTKNTVKNYKRLGGIIDDARYAGLVDWEHIVDRTRVYQELPHWGTPREDDPKANAKTFVDSVMPQFRTSKWDTQPLRMEVWVEKDALVDVIARPANGLDLGYFACRGYNSTSNAWAAARRIEGYLDQVERVIVLHLGDHDPEGIDMSRDIYDRFRTFLDGDGYDPDALEVRRIALNMDQVRQYNPPPNPAKETSSRFAGYRALFGTTTSWELDALDPRTIDALIRAEVEAERDDEAWAEAVANETAGRELLERVSGRWFDVAAFLNGGHAS